MLSAEVSLSYSLRKEPAVKSCGMTADTSACQTAAGWTGVLLFCFCFLFFSCALGPDTSLVSQKLGTTLVLVIFWEILITSCRVFSWGVYVHYQLIFSVRIQCSIEVNKNWSFKPVALMFWPPFILFICLFTMFEKWLVNQPSIKPSINWQIQVPATWQQQPLKAS